MSLSIRSIFFYFQICWLNYFFNWSSQKTILWFVTVNSSPIHMIYLISRDILLYDESHWNSFEPNSVLNLIHYCSLNSHGSPNQSFDYHVSHVSKSFSTSNLRLSACLISSLNIYHISSLNPVSISWFSIHLNIFLEINPFIPCSYRCHAPMNSIPVIC